MTKQGNDVDSFFGGFEAVVSDLSKGKPGSGAPELPENSESPIDLSDRSVSIVDGEQDYDIVEPEEVIGQEDGTVEEEEEIIEEHEKIEEDVSEEEEEINETEKVETVEEVSETDLGEAEESDIVDYFSEKLSESLGWEIEEENKPKTVEEVVNYLKNVVEENSTPTFANEELQKLNDFIQDGGDLRGYMEDVYGGLNLDIIDLENTSTQKAVVKENLSRLGYTDTRIKKLVGRYEEAGTLEEEAEDAVEVLEDYNSKKSETLLENAQKDREDLQERQQMFFADVQTNIEKLDSIRGIPITKTEKKDLLEYVFKPDSDGTTKYQKDYAKNNKNLIESAYFTMKGDSLVKKVERKATSQAARNLQEKLAKKGKRARNSGTQGVGQQNSLNAWDTVSSQLRRPNN